MARDRKAAVGLKRAGMLLLLMACCASALAVFHWPPRDKNGNSPRDVAKMFVNAVQSNDFVTAASFWAPGSVKNAESNFQMKFEEFCLQTFKCDTYKLSITWKQKGLYKVGFRGRRDGKEMRWGIYFKRVDGEWRIVEDLWIPDASGSSCLRPNSARPLAHALRFAASWPWSAVPDRVTQWTSATVPFEKSAAIGDGKCAALSRN